MPLLIRLDSRILLGELPCKRLDAVYNPLKVVLLLASNLATFHGRVVVAVAPLDLEGVEIDFGVQAVNVLGGM